jgi:hypothetical protein
MSWQEKREERFKKWLAADGISFSRPEAEKKYKERATRMIKAIKMEIPDRVPVHLTSAVSSPITPDTPLRTSYTITLK